jgi:hypothetical protein
LLVQQGIGVQQEIRRLSTWNEPGIFLARAPGSKSVFAGDGLIAAEPQDPGELLVKIDPDGNRNVLDEIERPADSNVAGYESLVPDPSGDRVAISEVTYRSSGASGRLSIRAALSGDKIAAIDTESGLAVVGWTNDGRLITRTTEVTRGRLQIRNATTLSVVSEIVGWEGFGATIVGDAVWGTASGTVLRGSTATGDIETVVALPSQITNDLIALLGPVDIEPAETEAPLITPRTPRSITPAERESRALIEASALDDENGSSTAFIGLAAAVMVVAASLGAIGWRRRTKTEDRHRQPDQAGT